MLLVLGLALASARLAGQERPGFDHQQHSKVFASCTACHAAAVTAGASMWPDPNSCATCHDGTIQKRVTWQPPREAFRTNLRFDHLKHATEVRDTVVGCTACHAAQRAPWMTAEAATAERCLDCHGVRTAHLAAPDTACATCHLPLAQATRLTVKQVAAFPKPPSHEQPDYAEAKGHGRASQVKGANCTTCHARDFCLQCHVDAPERPSIQALAADARSLAIRATLRPPATHADQAFLMGHGSTAKAAPEQCTACHTRESCLTCHSATTRVAARLPAAGPGRSTGAVVTRRRPPSHGANYAERHAVAAATAGATCAACHARSDCLECHRPDAAQAAGYHPRGFLTRHPAAAYSRQTNCSDCHNTAGFCTTCHASAGLVSKGGQLRAGYHDFNIFFGAGHGQAARQSLETCVGCHVEKDCLTCHSALGGRHINPHGPGFDPSREIKKNPQMCTACHGTAIPTQ
ncbi:MAG TPA: cytochrome c3 family protein [Gemmatimonadales bacterium]|nr:cytochrome c3 family protein [Gemmatimonadales bacterium]